MTEQQGQPVEPEQPIYEDPDKKPGDAEHPEHPHGTPPGQEKKDDDDGAEQPE